MATAQTTIATRPVTRSPNRSKLSNLEGKKPKTSLEPPVLAEIARGERLEIPPLSQAEISAAAKPRDILVISPPNIKTAVITVIGTAPYVQHKFSQKAQTKIEETQRAGMRAKKNTKKEARQFEEDYKNAAHVSVDGWYGIPASAFRNAMISACRVAGFAMTRAKLSIFVDADGFDQDGTPLVRIEGEPKVHQGWARNESGVCDLRWRPMWQSWKAAVQLHWDADQFSPADVLNLMARAGLQVGIGEGRPDSPKSNGMGWGVFRVETL